MTHISIQKIANLLQKLWEKGIWFLMDINNIYAHNGIPTFLLQTNTCDFTRKGISCCCFFCDKLHLKFSKFVGICLIGLQPKGFLAI